MGIQPSFDTEAARRIRGVTLEAVVADGPAARGGLRAGDVLVRVAGRSLESVDDLAAAMGSCRPGQTIEVVLLRTDPVARIPLGQEVRLHVVLEERGDR